MKIKYIEEKFNAMKHLKSCQKVVEKVYELMNLQLNFDKSEAILKTSEVLLEHKDEFNKIASFGSEKTVVESTYGKFMDSPERNELSYRVDIDYIIPCYILINAVKYGLEESIESGLKKIALEIQENNNE